MTEKTQPAPNQGQATWARAAETTAKKPNAAATTDAGTQSNVSFSSPIHPGKDSVVSERHHLAGALRIRASEILDIGDPANLTGGGHD